MTLFNQIRNFALVFVLATVAAFGQTALSTTTLSANINRTQPSFVLASVSGLQACVNAGAAQGGIGSPASLSTCYLFVDKEAMAVTGIVGTRVTVRRGTGTAAVAHNSSAVVTLAPSLAIHQSPTDPSGQCQRTTLAYVPYINATTGHTFDCLGVTTAGQWFQTNGEESLTALAGSTVASATSITPTGKFFVVSGTTAVATIVVPAGATAGYQLFINPSGIFATTTAGNIGLITSATVVGRVLIMTWDGSKWWPSYVS